MIHSRHPVLPRLLSLLFLSGLLTSCSTPQAIAELPTVTRPASTLQPAESSTASPGEPIQPTPSPQASLPDPSSTEIRPPVPGTPITVSHQPTPEQPLGGGTIQDGPFVFDLRLFRNPSFSKQPVASSLYSDLEGIGAYMYWSYQGSDAIGSVETYWGTLPFLDQLQSETYTSISFGSRGGRTGGVLLPGGSGSSLPGESKTGDRIQVALKVYTPNGDFGAVLHFTLNQGANGFEPTDISVDVLPPSG
jgi:hypothetical protein